MADEKEEKKTIKIFAVATPKKLTIDGRETVVCQFKGFDNFLYETWGEELVGQLEKDKEIVADVTHTTKDLGQGPQAVHRVTQIYVNGEPVRKASSRGSRSSRSYGKTDEQVRLERISIEGQTGCIKVMDLMAAKVIDLDHPQAKTALQYAEMKMRASMVKEAAPKPAPKPEPATPTKSEPAAPKAAPKPQPAPPTEPKETMPEEEKKKYVDQASLELVEHEAHEQGYVRDEVQALLSKYKVQSAKYLTNEQAIDLLARIRRGEGRHQAPATLL